MTFFLPLSLSYCGCSRHGTAERGLYFLGVHCVRRACESAVRWLAALEARAARVVGVWMEVLISVLTIRKQIVLLSRFFLMIRFNVLGKVSMCSMQPTVRKNCTYESCTYTMDTRRIKEYLTNIEPVKFSMHSFNTFWRRISNGSNH